MKKKPLYNLELNLYEETLKNGLRIYMIPNDRINNIYVTYTTFYGSCDNEFIPIGKSEYERVPDGIAHFLEHKVFEQKDGVDPFSFFSKNGADVNAYTSFYGTTYLFSGIEHFKENIQYLLNYVESPYFTDENVEKEKGIILQELKMHKDNPYRVGKIQIIENAFVHNSIRIPVIGTESSIQAITKENLYDCYYTFYHPSNMILVITGNFNPEDALEYIKEIEETRALEKQDEIQIKKEEEPDHVFQAEQIIHQNVSIPKAFLGIKLNLTNLSKKYSKYMIRRCLHMYMNIQFGNTSLLQEQLINENIINSEIEIDQISTDDHLLYILFADTKKPEILLDKMIEQLQNQKIEEADFIRKKKLYLASNISMSDNIYRLNEKVINDILLNKEVITDFYKVYDELNLETLYDIIQNLDFSNICKLIVKD